jgi:RNA polymerase sigma factor (sigma-70 family)
MSGKQDDRHQCSRRADPDAERLLRVVRRAIGGHLDVTEDACSFAWLQLLRTQPERDSIFPWLCTVAINEARRLLKGQARHAEFDKEAAGSASLPGGKGPNLQLTVEVREAFEHIAGLTAQQVRIFSLHVAGLSYDEICEATGYSWTQVNRHMGRARSGLRARRRGRHPSSGARPAAGG